MFKQGTNLKLHAPTFVQNETIRKNLTKWEHSPWEIDVPYEEPNNNDFYWSLALAYLIPKLDMPAPDLFKLPKRMVTANISHLLRNIYDDIKPCNPFFNRYARCFYSREFADFIDLFEKNIKSYKYSKKYGKLIKRCPNNKKLFRMMRKSEFPIQAAALLLQTEIVVICDSNCANNTKIFNFPSLVHTNDKIILHWKQVKKEANVWERVTFSLPVATTEKLQKFALQQILNLANIKEDRIFDIIFSMRASQNNLIQDLLQNKKFDIAKMLLQCPRFIILKLCHAGFDTYPVPSRKNNAMQKKVFLLSLKESSDELLFLIYDFFVDISVWSENAIRQRADRVKQKLLGLSKTLQKTREEIYEDKKKRQSKKSKADLANNLKRIEELIEFHKFQTSVHNNIITMNKGQNPNAAMDIVASIIKAYNGYFHMSYDTTKNADEEELYKLFVSHQRFFQILDSQAILFFYDYNFEARNEKGQSQQKICDSLRKMETSFARFVFLRKYYSDELKDTVLTHKLRTTQSNSANRYNSLRESGSNDDLILALIFFERRKLKKAIKKFLTVYQKSRDNAKQKKKKDASEKIVAEETPYFYTLVDEPVIKDHILSLRFRNSIKQALETNLDKEREISVAAIERCLQIIGENVFPELGPTSFWISLLISTLDKTTKDALVDARHILSHCKEVSLASRMEVEQPKKENDKNKDIFVKLQNELQIIESKFVYAFDLQNLIMRKYALENAIVLFNDWIQQRESNNQITLGEEDYVETLRGYLFDTNKELKTKLKILLPSYVEYFEASFDLIAQEFKKSEKPQRVAIKFKFLFCCLRDILKLMAELAIQNSRTLVEEIEFCQENLKQMSLDVNHFLQKYRNLKSAALKLLKPYKETIVRLDETFQHQVKNKKRRRQFIRQTSYAASSQNQKNQIEQFCLTLRSISDGIKDKILSSIPKKYKDHHAAQVMLANSIESRRILPENKRDNCIKCLILEKQEDVMKVRNMYDQEDLQGIQNIPDYYEKLQTALQTKTLSSAVCKKIFENFVMDDNIQDRIKTIFLSKDLNTREDILEYFFDRLIRLEKILIQSNDVIKHLWLKPKGFKMKMFMSHELVKCCLKDSKLQAAVEQLLNDCLIVLKEKGKVNGMKISDLLKARETETENTGIEKRIKKRRSLQVANRKKKKSRKKKKDKENEERLKEEIENLEYLWKKTTTHLFSGIDLRNTLTHGHSLLECIAHSLDPCDLLSEIIAKVVVLLSDIKDSEWMPVTNCRYKKWLRKSSKEGFCFARYLL